MLVGAFNHGLVRSQGAKQPLALGSCLLTAHMDPETEPVPSFRGANNSPPPGPKRPPLGRACHGPTGPLPGFARGRSNDRLLRAPRELPEGPETAVRL